MTDPEALDLAVAKTGHRRFRELLDPGHPDYEPGYWRVVREIATGEFQPLPMTVSRQSLPTLNAPLILMAVTCFYRDTGCSTCRGVRCWAGYGNHEGGRATTLAHCEACVGELVPFRRS